MSQDKAQDKVPDVAARGLDAARLLALMRAHPLERANNPAQPLAFPARANSLKARDMPHVRLSLLDMGADLADDGTGNLPGMLPDTLPDSAPFPALTGPGVEKALARISRARPIGREIVDELLARVPGIGANAAATSVSETIESAPRTALLVFTEPTCPHCRTALRLLDRLKESLVYPVLLLPIGESRASVDLYTRPRATLGEEEGKLVLGWLGAATEALCAIEGTNAPHVPTFVWVMDGDVRASTLSKSQLVVLLASLNARKLALEKPAGGNELPHNGNAIDTEMPQTTAS